MQNFVTLCLFCFDKKDLLFTVLLPLKPDFRQESNSFKGFCGRPRQEIFCEVSLKSNGMLDMKVDRCTDDRQTQGHDMIPLAFC